MVAVILAGGSGTRLWPLGQESCPKQFLPLAGGTSLFQMACARAAAVAGSGNLLVVSGAPHLPWVRRQAPAVRPSRIIVEEHGRNTAAAVALAGVRVRRDLGEALMIVLPADHFIASPAEFRATMRRALRAASRSDGLVTIGLTPLEPSSRFGYLRPAAAAVFPGVHRVTEFVEKPPARRAAAMVRSGKFLWNSGIFVWRSSVLLEEMGRHSPALLREAERWAGRAGVRPWRIPARVMRRFPSIPIDRALLERSERVLTVRGRLRWSDVGTWDAVADLLAAGGRKNPGRGAVVDIDARGCVGYNEKGVTAFVGVRNVVAVRVGRAVLVCRRGASDRVGEIGARLRGGVRGRSLR